MHKNWKGKNVDLGLLTSRIGDFFKTKDFQAIKGEIPTGYQILAEDSPHFKISGYVSAAVEGTPNDFVVKFDLCTKEKKHSLPHSMFLETMFFGGYFLSRRLKSDEAWLKLEKEFWRHVENVVPYLINSAGSSVQPPE
ncbi:MAG: hypothetical protein OEZ25_04240 [Candidatus Bathyarchaeota archaeon]|nr:hypothetical protein [Candidatus Bathyarchaeota archaeon]